MKKQKRLPPETIQGLIGLAKILQKIHNRLIAEGYVIKDGMLIDREGNVIYPKHE